MKKIILALVVVLLFTGCISKTIGTQEQINNQISNENVDLEGYYQTETFSNHNGVINKDGEFSSTSDKTSEAWYIKDVSIKSTKDFEVSAKVSVPDYWNTLDKKNAQVGCGIFVGKKDNGGKLCFESDLCVIASEVKFVQGQNIKNRLSGDPDEVVFKEANSNVGIITVKYSADEKSFILYLNEELVGESKIGSDGKVDWNMADDDQFIVGIMGFSEHTNVTDNYPVVKDFTIKQ